MQEIKTETGGVTNNNTPEITKNPPQQNPASFGIPVNQAESVNQKTKQNQKAADMENKPGNSKAVITTSSSDDSKKSVVKIIIGILLIVIVGVGGFYLYSQFTAPKEVNNQQLTTIPAVNKVTPAPTIVPTEAQKQLSIYTDEDYGYSLNYPSEFIKADYQEGNYYGISLTYLGSGQQRPQSELVDGVVLKILVIDDAEDDLEGFVIKQREKEINDTQEISVISQTMFSDRVGYQYTITGQGEYKEVFVENGGNIIRISTNIQGSQEDITKYQSMADEIVDSITFTSVSTQDTPTSATKSAN